MSNPYDKRPDDIYRPDWNDDEDEDWNEDSDLPYQWNLREHKKEVAVIVIGTIIVIGFGIYITAKGLLYFT